MREDIPDHVCFENHYHTLDFEGVPPDALEGVFAQYEGPACRLFAELAANPGRPFRSKGELETALLFLSLQAARVPLSKERFESAIKESGEKFMREIAYNRGFFEKVINIARQHGEVIDADQESLREAVDSGNLYVKADRGHIALGILRLMAAIFEQIGPLHVTLWYADGPDWFVCSDHPVGLFYTIQSLGSVEDVFMALEEPQVQLRFDTVFMPLAKNVAMVIHKQKDVPAVQRAHQRMVGVVNALTIGQAKRSIYSTTSDFVCGLPGGRLGNARETIEFLAKLAGKNRS
jgi:hypothetical protein